jgi:uncharacterized repeat protein (TIGR01451 family)
VLALGIFSSIALAESDSPSASAAYYYYSPPAPAADLSIVKTGPDELPAGFHLFYSITITNNGPDRVDDVSMSDPLPPGLADALATPSQGTCAGDSLVSCNLGGLLEGQSATVEIVADTAKAKPGWYANRATVFSAPTSDPNGLNNSSVWSTLITGDDGH